MPGCPRGDVRHTCPVLMPSQSALECHCADGSLGFARKPPQRFARNRIDSANGAARRVPRCHRNCSGRSESAGLGLLSRRFFSPLSSRVMTVASLSESFAFFPRASFNLFLVALPVGPGAANVANSVRPDSRVLFPSGECAWPRASPRRLSRAAADAARRRHTGQAGFVDSFSLRRISARLSPISPVAATSSRYCRGRIQRQIHDSLASANDVVSGRPARVTI